MQQPCWRVAIRVYRKDVAGITHIVERSGPVIQAADSLEAIEKARAIFEGDLDFASTGAATYLHMGHRGLISSPTERRPAQSPEIDLLEQLARMASSIRRRRGH